MPLRVGIVSTAHLHVWGYAPALVAHPEVSVSGVWDDDGDRLADFCERANLKAVSDLDTLLSASDAVVICSENLRHVALAELAAAKGCHILCEKPLIANENDAATILDVARRVKVMTAFPCRYSPAFGRLRERVRGGEIGNVKAICATNRGRCPFGWFVGKELSGGGAMIDHTVHVADLLRTLLGEEPTRVEAQTGSNLYGKDWEDTAMLTIEFADGVFATLDSSWSRPASYKTWGDVTMNVVGERGVIELDLFGQTLDVYSSGETTHRLAGYGSNLDADMVADFVRSCLDGSEPPITAYDGVQASRVALAGYRSAASGEVVTLA